MSKPQTESYRDGGAFGGLFGADLSWANGSQVIGDAWFAYHPRFWPLAGAVNARLNREHFVDRAAQGDEASSYFDRCLGADVSCKKAAQEVGAT